MAIPVVHKEGSRMCSRRRGNCQTGRKPGQSICQGVCINPRTKNPVVFWISSKSPRIYICEKSFEDVTAMLNASVTMLLPKYLNPRVAPIRNKNIVLVVDSHPRWCVELTIAFSWWCIFLESNSILWSILICGNLTICAKTEYEGSLLGEDLDVMIVKIGDHDVAVRICCHVVRSSKLGTIGTSGTKLRQHLEKFFL